MIAGLIDAKRFRELHFLADWFRDLRDITMADSNPRLQRRCGAGDDVDYHEHPKLVPPRKLVMDEVHRQVSFDRVAGPQASRGFALTRRFGVWCTTAGPIRVRCSLLVLAVHPAIATKNDMNAATSVANADMTALPDPLFESSLARATCGGRSVDRTREPLSPGD